MLEHVNAIDINVLRSKNEATISMTSKFNTAAAGDPTTPSRFCFFLIIIVIEIMRIIKVYIY